MKEKVYYNFKIEEREMELIKWLIAETKSYYLPIFLEEEEKENENLEPLKSMILDGYIIEEMINLDELSTIPKSMVERLQRILELGIMIFSQGNFEVAMELKKLKEKFEI